ncbi:hypothetical protein PM082_018559 [Marasmius tenuissimus]|nr:hypothetical protein PM082_018559 [Marasmius tenuissimus]
MQCPSILPSDCFNLVSRPPVLHSVGLLLYGIHTVLYMICLYILLTRKRVNKHKHVVLITALFIASTVGVGLKYNIYTLEAQMGIYEYSQSLLNTFSYTPGYQKLSTADTGALKSEMDALLGILSPLNWESSYLRMRLGAEGITIVGNCLTDVLLLWRCYLTWRGTAHRTLIMLFPCLCALCINGETQILKPIHTP